MDPTTLSAFVLEMEKISASSPQKGEDETVRQRLTGSLPGYLAASGTTGLAAYSANRSIESLRKGFTDPRTVPVSPNTTDLLKKHIGVPEVPHRHFGNDPVLANFMPRSTPKFVRDTLGLTPEQSSAAGRAGLASFSSNAPVEIAAHEFGHAKNYKQLGSLLHGARLLGGAGATVGTGMAVFGKNPHGKAVRYAPLVSALSQAPLLGDEIMASVRGYRAIKKLGLSPTQLAHARKQLLRAGSTYGLQSAATVAAPYLIGASRRWMQSRRKKNEQPTQTQGALK